MNPLTCFVAGAYSSKYGTFGRFINIVKMFVYTRRLIKLGFVPVAPNVIYCLFASLQPREFWLSGTRSLLRQCNIVFMVPGWESSEGAKAEYADAQERNQPTFTSLLTIKDFGEKSVSHHTESVS